MKPINPDYCTPPGDTIRYALEDLGMTREELAERAGMPTETINEIIRATTPLTPDAASRIGPVIKYPPHLLLNIERMYRKFFKARKEGE